MAVEEVVQIIDRILSARAPCQKLRVAQWVAVGLGQQGSVELAALGIRSAAIIPVRRKRLDDSSEGIVIWKNNLIQLTWQHGIGFVYDRDTFQPRRTFSYSGEGWGLTYDGTRLIMSDGSPTLRFLDATTLKETGRMTVRDHGKPVEDLNELEIVKGEILANVYQTERIVRISPKTGQVTGWIDLRGLLSSREKAGVDVLNGIAYDSTKDRLFVTGKLWPRLFEIEIVQQ